MDITEAGEGLMPPGGEAAGGLRVGRREEAIPGMRGIQEAADSVLFGNSPVKAGSAG